jgi:hypothetical protein
MAKANSSHAHAAPQLNESTPKRRVLLGHPANESTNLRVVSFDEQLIREGQRFGRILILGPEFMLAFKKNQRRRMVVVQCDCGRIQVSRVSDIFHGLKHSCECLGIEMAVRRMTKHGKGRHQLVEVWRAMKRRCYEPTVKMYYRYGGRGITVCDQWRDDFVSFYEWAIANGWESGLSIERIDNNGNYEPSNCCIATKLQQANNTSKNRYLNAFGERKSASQWARDARCVVSYHTLLRRARSGWNHVDAITLQREQSTKDNPQ